MYDFLLAADHMVSDPDAVKAFVCDKLVMPAQRDTWRQDLPNHSYLTWHCRVHKSLAVAPTRLMIQGHKEIPNPSDPMFKAYLHNLAEIQGPARPMKAHAMVLISRRLPELLEKLVRRKLPFRVAPIADGLPFDRLWVGVTPNDLYYEPDVDGGLFIEVMEPGPLQLPEDTWAVPAPGPNEPGEGDMIRIVSRGYLVEDLDDTVRRLSLNLDWEPAGPIEDVPEEGYRRARMHFELAHGADVELIQPTRYECMAGRFLATWGPGPYFTRIAVHGLEARREILEAHGTRTLDMPVSRVVEGGRFLAHPDDLAGMRFEFVEFQG